MVRELNVLPSGEYCIYLRKSRADMDAEARGEGETLAKHKKMLLALAKRYKINITRIYQEIVSGDRIAERPEVMKLLSDVEEGKWKGVLVIEVERLARGDTIDQGMVAQAFKMSSTLIITLNKTYDPNDEFDEEYFEFGLFMSRREHKTIKRRLQRGIVASVEEGNYVGARPPYGYQIAYTEDDSRYLIPHPEQAEIVKMIFDWYVNGITDGDVFIEMGSTKIARKLQDMGVPTYNQSMLWEFNVVLQMLKNEVYVGRIQRGKRKRPKKSDSSTKKQPQGVDKEKWIDVKGKHEGIVDIDIFNRAQTKLKENLSTPVKDSYAVVNPFARLLFCGKCGKSMVLKPFPKYRKTKGYSIKCNSKYCDCKGSNFDLVEQSILNTIEEVLRQYKSIGKRTTRSFDAAEVKEKLIQSLKGDLATLESQKGSLFDLLERKIYDEETFLDRSRNLSERIEETKEKIAQTEKQLGEESSKVRQKDVIPTIKDALTEYKKSNDQQRKNSLMKSILARIEYTKEKSQTGEDFTIKVTFRNL